MITKDYFFIVFSSVLMCNKILKDRNSGVPVCGEFLTCNILLPNKAVQKLTGNLFFTPIILKNQIKTSFEKKKKFNCVMLV